MSRVLEQSTETVPIDSISPHPRNPRIGDVSLIQQSISENGFYGAVIVQRKSRHIIAGNHRWKAAKHLGIKQIPAILVDIDDAKALEILLADNHTSDAGKYDDRILASLLSEINQSGNLAATMFTDADLNELLAGIAKEDKIKAKVANLGEIEPKISLADELQKKWRVEPGDIYEAGNHRLICGDALDPDVYQALLGGNKVALMLTDPPYGVSLGEGLELPGNIKRNRRKDGLKIENDDLTADNLGEFLSAWLAAAVPHIAQGGVFYICHADALSHIFRSAVIGIGLHLAQGIIWLKDQFVMGRQDYQWKHEPILYGWKKGKTHFWNGSRKLDTIIECPRPKRSPEHPTMKPVELMAILIRNSLRPGGSILEPFAGSGSTILAAEMEQAKCFAIEKSPRFCAVILERLTDAGLKVKKVNPK